MKRALMLSRWWISSSCLLLWGVVAHAALRENDNLDYGAPGASDQVVERIGYSLGYVNAWRQPAWVSYRLTAWEASGTISRSDDFREDPAIPASCQATLTDYANSGYDRGHLSPAADNAWSQQAMSESFYLSNMSPQNPTLNRGLWSRIESAVRNFALYEESIVVVTGPVVTNGAHSTIGGNAVLVPDGYYKVVYAENYGKMIGFVVWQDSRGKVTDFACSVDEVEALTGLDFFANLEDVSEAALESQCFVDNWCWEEVSKEDTDEEIWEDYVVDPVDPIVLSDMSRSWCARTWDLDLLSLTNVYPRVDSRNPSVWTNGVTVKGLQAFTGGVPVTDITRNHGAQRTSGYYVYWDTNNVVGAYSFGCLTADKIGRQVFGVAFRNDLKSDVEAIDVEYIGRQFGFRNTVAQTLACELLVTNRLLAVCNGVGWTVPEGLSFTTPVVGNPDSLAHGSSLPVAQTNSIRRLPIRVRPGEYLHLRFGRDSMANGAAMGIDNLKIRFSTRGGCVILR